MRKVYLYEGKVFDDEGIATLIAENCEEMLIKVFGEGIRPFLSSLPTFIIDDIKDWIVDDMCGHANYDMVGVKPLDVIGREAAQDMTPGATE